MQWNKAAISLLKLEVLVKNMAKITPADTQCAFFFGISAFFFGINKN